MSNCAMTTMMNIFLRATLNSLSKPVWYTGASLYLHPWNGWSLEYLDLISKVVILAKLKCGGEFGEYCHTTWPS